MIVNDIIMTRDILVGLSLSLLYAKPKNNNNPTSTNTIKPAIIEIKKHNHTINTKGDIKYNAFPSKGAIVVMKFIWPLKELIRKLINFSTATIMPSVMPIIPPVHSICVIGMANA